MENELFNLQKKIMDLESKLNYGGSKTLSSTDKTATKPMSSLPTAAVTTSRAGATTTTSTDASQAAAPSFGLGHLEAKDVNRDMFYDSHSKNHDTVGSS